jgi:hypothetical protein
MISSANRLETTDTVNEVAASATKLGLPRKGHRETNDE